MCIRDSGNDVSFCGVKVRNDVLFVEYYAVNLFTGFSCLQSYTFFFNTVAEKYGCCIYVEPHQSANAEYW